MRSRLFNSLAGVGIVAVTCAIARAEAAESADIRAEGLEEIIVTARRKEESLQDVPTTISVVTSELIEKMNVFSLPDIGALVPGLTLSGGNSFSTSATVRGVAFNPEASGNNPTVEFYLNDAPISSNFLFQSLFDVGQFELLRGPQGTLRGRASPSGSITLRARRPNLSEFGASVNASASDADARRGELAINLPIVTDKLGLRIAGVYDENEGNGVHSIKQWVDSRINPEPNRETQAVRASLRFNPTDWLDVNFMYQKLEQENVQYSQAVSSSLVTGEAPSGEIIDSFDRRSIQDSGSRGRQDQDIFILNSDSRFGGQVLSYVGSYNKQDFVSLSEQDTADYFATPRFAFAERAFTDPAGYEAVCAEQGARTDTIATTQSYFQCTHGVAKRTSHELRLASEERIADRFDYVIGVLHDKNETPSRLTQETPLLAAANPPRIGLVNLTAITRNGESTEKSVFANVTARFGEKFELSGGPRYIDYRSDSSILSGATRPIPDQHEQDNATIYTVSAKYRFNDDLMTYATVGSSWRPGAFAVGDFNLQPTERERSFFDLSPEESTSYEIGVKTSFLEERGRLNLSLFRQDFDNYVYRGAGVYFVNYTLQGNVVRPAVASFNFVAGVPATVDGAELEASFQITPRWNVSSNVAYADGQVENGLVACTDLNGDGVPDRNAALPALAQLQTAVGTGENVAQCRISRRASVTPKWSANLQTEADFPLGGRLDGFVRGLVVYQGSTQGDPDNTLDGFDAFALVNLWTGVRDPDGRWELSLFVKNAFENERILSRSGSPLSSTTRTFTGSVNYMAPYYDVSTTSPREFGVSFRLALGSR